MSDKEKDPIREFKVYVYGLPSNDDQTFTFDDLVNDLVVVDKNICNICGITVCQHEHYVKKCGICGCLIHTDHLSDCEHQESMYYTKSLEEKKNK